MGFNFSSWSIILCVLLFSMFAQAGSTRKITAYSQKIEDGSDTNYLQQGSYNYGSQKRMQAHPSSHMEDMDPSVNLFFKIEDLKVGKTMPICFSAKDPSTSSQLLSREEANSIPFSSTQLPYLLEFFSFSRDCPQAKAMEHSLRLCELAPVEGEMKLCATSLESMLDFARTVFGLDAQFKVLATKFPKKPTMFFQNYTILDEPGEISAMRMIGCHKLPYPYAVFYCHSQESGDKLFEISLVGENGERVQAIAVCHIDTSQWDHDHVSFRVLKIHQGTSPVCHFFPVDNLVWVS